GANYHSSEQLDFPFQLCYQENEITIEYTLTARVYSTSSSGQHFYSEVIRSFNNQSGVYKYDDLNEGTAVLISNDPTTLSGYKPQTVLVAYKLNDFNSHSIYSDSRARTFMEKLNNHNINILDEKIHSGIDCK
ncbi:2820_t:CDS:2, partial [Entrophospora sp. SA101]